MSRPHLSRDRRRPGPRRYRRTKAAEAAEDRAEAEALHLRIVESLAAVLSATKADIEHREPAARVDTTREA